MPEELTLDDYVNSLLDKVRNFHAAIGKYPDLPVKMTQADWDDQFLAWLSMEEEE